MHIKILYAAIAFLVSNFSKLHAKKASCLLHLDIATPFHPVYRRAIYCLSSLQARARDYTHVSSLQHQIVAAAWLLF